ncbi:MAG: glycerate kinase [Proteobacteria bacterium]|nr:glycerate kinase [Pseudomonadota bacterium]
MRVLIAPATFKGSLSAGQAAEAIRRGLADSGLDFKTELMPIADGGDDTLEVLMSPGGRLVETLVRDPLGRPITACFGVSPGGDTAVVEMARASGLQLLADDELRPMRTSTFGTGQLVARAADTGAERIIIGVGGSATVDGGLGCLTALGVDFLDGRGQRVAPVGGALSRVRRIDPGRLSPAVGRTRIQVACDVDHPVLGPRGAAPVFGPQKGASPADVVRLEAGLTHFFTLVRDQLGVDVTLTPRGGAAGGLAAGLAAFLGGELVSGIELVLDYLDIEARLRGVAAVITGEGCLDDQTLGGKAPYGLAAAARSRGVPVYALAGRVEVGEDRLRPAGFEGVFSLTESPEMIYEGMARAEELLRQRAAVLGRRIWREQKKGPSGEWTPDGR